MVRSEILALLLILALPAASGLQFGVEVGKDVDASYFELEQTNYSDATAFNLSVENPASVGCNYRMRGDFYADDKYTFYSGDSGLFPGATAEKHLMFTATNYTGEVEAALYLEYCMETVHLENRTFEVENGPVTERIESDVLSVTDRVAVLEIDGNGTLIPVEQPPLWRIGQTELENGNATINYNPPLFRDGKNVTFVLNRGGENIGFTEIELVDPEASRWEKLMDYSNELLLGGIALLLLLLNLYQGRELIRAQLKDLK